MRLNACSVRCEKLRTRKSRALRWWARLAATISLLAIASYAIFPNQATSSSQDAPTVSPVEVTDDLQPIIDELLKAIEMLSDYRVDRPLPPVFRLPQHALEAKVCEEPCTVTAIYLPREGIYLADNLDPVNQTPDRAALVHELVHYLQQGHPKFARMKGCEREKSKEQEAYSIQNAYLARIGSGERVVFYDGEFDCGDDRARSE